VKKGIILDFCKKQPILGRYFLFFVFIMHTRPSLPYSLDALSPYISQETLQFHSEKHHQTYVDNLNTLIPGTPHESQDIETIIQTSSGGIFNNAAQVWNHTFYFEGLAPAGSAKMDGEIRRAILQKWGSEEAFKAAFGKIALGTFGSGWAWLVRAESGELDILSTSNAGCPLTQPGVTALLTCDVWEHAYYIDTRNARAKYIENFWNVVNWAKVEERFATCLR
jgi:Fe-Mn family superoxide dismutase